MKKLRRLSLKVGLALIAYVLSFAIGGMSEATDEWPQGVYVGFLPCADCPGIAYQLRLKSDWTYTESRFYTERSDQPIVREGAYTIEGSTVVLDKDDEGLKYFGSHPSGLRVLDIHGEAITGGLRSQYILTRKTPSEDATLKDEALIHMRKKIEKGIDFYAFGNEPFWSLDIDLEKGMRFKSLTSVPEISTPPAGEDRAQDGQVIRYSAETELGSLDVTLLRATCTDTMSGEMFPYKVRIGVKTSVDSDYTNFEGCGRYVVDGRLQDVWVLTRFGDRKLKPTDFQRGLPLLEFHLNKEMIAGSAGCNRFSGRFEARGKKILLGPLATTKMACPNMSFEQEFLSAIAGQALKYTIANGRLVLRNDDGLAMELNKTD